MKSTKVNQRYLGIRIAESDAPGAGCAMRSAVAADQDGAAGAGMFLRPASLYHPSRPVFLHIE